MLVIFTRGWGESNIYFANESGIDMVGFRNMREMKQFQQRRRSQSSVEDVRRVQGSKVATPGPEFKPGSILNTSECVQTMNAQYC